jgi:predicted nucleic acid-binding protein
MKCSIRAGGLLISIAIVDTGPLVAAADSDESPHAACLAVLERGDLIPVIPSLVIAEAGYLIGQRLGASGESKFLHEISTWEIEPLTPADLRRSAELIARYADLGLGTTDAAVVATAERLGATTIITLDRRHFSVVRPKHVESFELLPT